ncbi:MAG: ferritin-like domain-containing protein [Wolinella sp.]
MQSANQAPQMLTQEEAVVIALDDEFKAFETYKAIALKFQVEVPFGRIAEAELRHIQALMNVANRLGIPIPPNRWGGITPPQSLEESYQLGIKAEIENIALYDRLLPAVSDPEVRDIFYALQAASFNNHLPAFQLRRAGGVNPLNALFSSLFSTNALQAGGKLKEAEGLLRRLGAGEASAEEVSQFLQGVNLSLLGGALLGGIGTLLLQELQESSKQKEE